MRHRVLTMFLAGGLLAAAVGCEVNTPTPTELLAEVWDEVEATPVTQTVYDYSQADAIPDIDQTPDDSGDRYLTVFRSSSATGVRPAVMYVHGGGFVMGSRYEINTPGEVVGTIGEALYAQVRDSRGWVVISVDYRFGPYPQGLDDVNQALTWVKTNASTLQIDPAQIVIAGSSAGGNLASMVGLQPSGAEVVAGVVNLDGPNNLAGVTGSAAVEGRTVQGLIDDYLECDVPPTGPRTETCAPGAVAAASPITYLNSSDPPVYLACGAMDHDFVDSLCADHIAMHDQSELVNGNDARAWLDVIDDGTHFTIDQTINLRVLEEFLDGAIQPN